MKAMPTQPQRIDPTPEVLANLPYADHMTYHTDGFKHRVELKTENSGVMTFLFRTDVFDRNRNFYPSSVQVQKGEKKSRYESYSKKGKELFDTWEVMLKPFIEAHWTKAEPTFEEKLQSGYYSGKDIVWPKSIDKGAIRKSVEDVFVGTKAQIEDEVQRQINVAKEEYQAEYSISHAASNKRSQEFKADLFDYYGVWENPKKEKAYDIAYDGGHANGYQEVANYFGELVELIK